MAGKPCSTLTIVLQIPRCGQCGVRVTLKHGHCCICGAMLAADDPAICGQCLSFQTPEVRHLLLQAYPC